MIDHYDGKPCMLDGRRLSSRDSSEQRMTEQMSIADLSTNRFTLRQIVGIIRNSDFAIFRRFRCIGRTAVANNAIVDVLDNTKCWTPIEVTSRSKKILLVACVFVFADTS